MKQTTYNPGPSQFRTQAYQTAVAAAVVASVFLLLVCATLLTLYLRARHLESTLDHKLQQQKLQLHADPENQALRSRIRTDDILYRRNKLRILYFLRTGAPIALVSLAVLLTALKSASAIQPKLPARPVPLPSHLQQRRFAHHLRRTRRALAATFAALTISALLLAVLSEPKFPSAAQPPTAAAPSPKHPTQNWTRFRGPAGSGISPYTNIPISWDAKTGRNILWKTKVPLPGHNSPIVWQNRIFLSGATDKTQQVYCFDADTGRLLWTQPVTRTPDPPGEPLEIMEDTGFAPSTMATDGQRIYAIFPTGDLACFDFAGKKLWQKNLGKPDSVYGYASSLETFRNFVIIQYDQGAAEDNKSAIIAIDGYSGQLLWQTKRPVAASWTTPIVVNVNGQYQLITAADPYVIAYNPADGTELWRAKCVSGDLAPSPIYSAGLVLAIEPYSHIVAIKPDGTGDVTTSHIAWKAEQGAPDICSPLGTGQLVFLLETEGLLSCYNLAEGNKLWEHDFKTEFRASPSLVDDKLYLLSVTGTMFIIQAATQYKELARCELGEKCFASPAFADGRIYIRSTENLFCIAQTTVQRQ